MIKQGLPCCDDMYIGKYFEVGLTISGLLQYPIPQSRALGAHSQYFTSTFHAVTS